ncbi:DUF4232 domain-containing protein [Streptomyces sp. JW3]|uniref:DUF4232 domain-containing protein n=1 Tax=Streptomyces sp. JW3 TaxID=3456955 RepID=UPI003FA4CD9B
MRTTRPTALAVSAVAALLLPVLTSCSDAEGGNADDRGDGAACRIGGSGTEVAASPAPAAGDTGTVTVTLTNRGSECLLEGFPTVTLLVDGASKEIGREEGASTRQLTLAKDAAASFTLTYVRGEDDGAGLDVRTARFALPGASATQDIPWSYGAVATKEGDGSGDESGDEGGPDATVSAFQQMGD